MHTSPREFDASLFLGHTATQICFTENTATIHFGDDLSASMLSSLVYKLSSDAGVNVETIPVASSHVMGLLGKTVIAAVIVDEVLVLSFQDGSRLEFHDNSPEYESYSIRSGDREVFVWRELLPITK